MLFFTVCAINQLAEAFVLGDSLKAQSPDYQLVIGLVDEKSRIPSDIKTSFEIIEVSAIQVPQWEDMQAKYTCDELIRNTKPFFAEYFLNHFSKGQSLVYLDATSLIFNRLDFVEEDLKENNIVLVPQLITAGKHPDEKQILNTGIFHAGFFALKRSDETFKFLHWWQARVTEKGFIALCKGMNAEQLWLEHVPALFEGVKIEKNEGLNVGKWNIAERKVQVMEQGNNWVSNHSPLISYNFQGVDYWKFYQQQLQKYQPHLLVAIQPKFGIYIKSKRNNFLTRTLRKMASGVDELVDLVG